MTLNQDDFKRVLGSFATGVTIVTFKNDEEIHGLTVNAFSSVSLDPPLILVCVKKNSTSHTMISESTDFVVNILSDKQKDLAWNFANPKLGSQERYENVCYEFNRNGVPVFADNLAWLECKTVEQLAGGDHTVFIGRVEDVGFSEIEKPLLYYRSKFHGI